MGNEKEHDPSNTRTKPRSAVPPKFPRSGDAQGPVTAGGRSGLLDCSFSRTAHRGHSSASLTKARTGRLLSGLARGDYSPGHRIFLRIETIIMLYVRFVNVKSLGLRKFHHSDKVGGVPGPVLCCFYQETGRAGALPVSLTMFSSCSRLLRAQLSRCEASAARPKSSDSAKILQGLRPLLIFAPLRP